MAGSYIEYTGNGTSTDFTYPFTADFPAVIKGFVNGVETPVTNVSQGLVRFSTAPASGANVRVARVTSATPVVTFSASGGAVLEDDLNAATKQAIYVAEEARDKVGDVLLLDVETVHNSAIASEAAATLATASANTATAAATAAAASAAQAAAIVGEIPAHTHPTTDITNFTSTVNGLIASGVSNKQDHSANLDSWSTIQTSSKQDALDDTNVSAIVADIDGGGSTITTGAKGSVVVPFKCTILGWYIIANESGSIVVDIWKDILANGLPTVADTITGSAKPTVNSAVLASSTTLTGWNTTVNANDILKFNVDSVTTIKQATLVLKVRKVP